MYLVKLCVMFVCCYILSACGQSAVDKANKNADKTMSFVATDMTPCEIANTCKTFSQIDRERKAMRAAAASAVK